MLFSPLYSPNLCLAPFCAHLCWWSDVIGLNQKRSMAWIWCAGNSQIFGMLTDGELWLGPKHCCVVVQQIHNTQFTIYTGTSQHLTNWMYSSSSFCFLLVCGNFSHYQVQEAFIVVIKNISHQRCGATVWGNNNSAHTHTHAHTRACLCHYPYEDFPYMCYQR